MAILSNEQLEELKQLDTPTICNALEIFNIRPRLEGFTNPGLIMRTGGKPIIGYAATAKVSGRHPIKGGEERLLGYYGSIRDLDTPVIACIQDTDAVPVGSFWGEVQATLHLALGSVGALVDGGVRDLKEVNELGYTMMSTCLLCSHGYCHVVDYNCTVDICGMTVNPGDLVFADQHGAVVIPPEVAPKLADACRRVGMAEEAILTPARKAIADGYRPSVDDIRAWRADLAAAKKKYY